MQFFLPPTFTAPSPLPNPRFPHCPCRISICPLVLAFETLPAAGFELQRSIPSRVSLLLAKPLPHTEPSRKLRSPGWRSRAAKTTPRSLHPLRWLSLGASRRRTCSTAPGETHAGLRWRETASRSRTPAPGQPHWPPHHMGPGVAAGRSGPQPAYLSGRGSRPPLLSKRTPTPPVPGSS